MGGSEEFNSQLDFFSKWFLSQTHLCRNDVFDHLLHVCDPQELFVLAAKLHLLLKRDFINNLPPELSLEILQYISPESLCNCALVSKSWHLIINGNTRLWKDKCKGAGIKISDENKFADACYYKRLYIHVNHRIKNIDQEVNCISLKGHTERICALAYHKGKIASGSDDRTVRIWDGETGECMKVIHTHTVAALKFDDVYILTASYDTTAACWCMESGHRKQLYEGHVASLFSIDYNVQHDRVVTGAADKMIKLWSMTNGTLLKSFTLHASQGFWIRQVLLCYNVGTLSTNSYMIACRNKYSFAIFKLSLEDDSVTDASKRIIVPGPKPDTVQTFGLLQKDNTLLMLFSGWEEHRKAMRMFIGRRPLNFGNDHAWSTDLGGSYRLECKPPSSSSWNENRSTASYVGSGLEFSAVIMDYDCGDYFLDINVAGKIKSKGMLKGLLKLHELANTTVYTFGETGWLDGLDGKNDTGVILATFVLPNWIHVYKWKSSTFNPKKLSGQL